MGPRITLLQVEEKGVNPNWGYFRIYGFHHAGHASNFASSLRCSLQDNIICRQFFAVKPRLEIDGKENDTIFTEYSVIPGVKESVKQIMDNLALVKFRYQEQDQQMYGGVQPCSLVGRQPGPVTTRSISKPDLEIIHTDQPIFTIIDANVSLTLDLQTIYNNLYSGELKLMDSWLRLSLRPSRLLTLTYQVVNEPDIIYTQPGRNIFPEVVYFEIETDGSITPIDALVAARKALYEEHKDFADYEVVDPYADYQVIDNSVGTKALDAVDSGRSSKDGVEQDTRVLANSNALVDRKKSSGKNSRKALEQSSISIQDLGITARAYNCLKRAQINTVGDLLDYSKRDLLQIKNFGVKSAEEVLEALQNKLGTTLPD